MNSLRTPSSAFGVADNRIVSSSEGADISKNIAELTRLASEDSHSLAAGSFDLNEFYTMRSDEQKDLIKCMQAGIKHPDSVIGCYAARSSDYDRFDSFFGKVIQDYHGFVQGEQHTSTWDMKGLPGLPKNASLRVGDLNPSQPEIYLRVRASRNFGQVPLPASMSRDDRIRLETHASHVLHGLKSHPIYGGRYYSLTPGHEDYISEQEYEHLLANQIMFKPGPQKRLLKAAGISDDWPVGRGAYVSDNGRYIVWVGEEDHLRVTAQLSTDDLMVPFLRVQKLLEILGNAPGLKYAQSKRFGFVTSCPARLGTTLYATMQLQLPNLVQNMPKVRSVCKMLGLDATYITSKQLFEVTNQKRLGVTEAKTIANMWTAIQTLYRADAAVTKQQAISASDW